MARSLASLGISVVRKLTVGDVAPDIQVAVRSAMEVRAVPAELDEEGLYARIQIRF